MRRWLPMLMWLAMAPAMAGAQSLPPWKYPTTLANDPNTSRLFFAPTGRALKRGEAYVSVFEALLPSVQIGVTDLFSIGGGTPVIPFEGASRPFWITPKLQVLHTAKTSASIGAIRIFNEGGGGRDRIAYGVVTHGGSSGAVTIGGGYAYGPGGAGRSPLIMIGAEHGVRTGLKFVTENYKFEEGGLLGGGLRYYSDKWSADFGMMVIVAKHSNFSREIGAAPVINIARRF